MSHDDFDFEPVPGLPALLPAGERLLWQGTPEWRSLAVRAYHVRKVAGYFLVLIAWRMGVGVSEGHTAAAIANSCLILAALGGAAMGVLSLLAYLNARSTVYSLTSRRVLLRHGVAVPLTLNLPLGRVDGAALKSFGDGTGDIALATSPGDRVGYLISWPHVRPGRYARPQPSLRAVRDARRVAAMLSAAWASEAGPEATRAAAQPGKPAGLEPRMSGLRPAAA